MRGRRRAGGRQPDWLRCWSACWPWWNSAVSASAVARPRACSTNRLASRHVGAGEALGLDRRLALGVDGDLDGLHAAPPTLMVSLTEPSARGCSTTEWPRLRASMRGLLDGVGLEEAVELLLVAPGAVVVVVADVAGGGVDDGGVEPAGQAGPAGRWPGPRRAWRCRGRARAGRAGGRRRRPPRGRGPRSRSGRCDSRVVLLWPEDRGAAARRPGGLDSINVWWGRGDQNYRARPAARRPFRRRGRSPGMPTPTAPRVDRGGRPGRGGRSWTGLPAFQMTLAARLVQASRTTAERSYRTRIRRSPFSQLMVRSTTHRTRPRPLPCGSLAWRCAARPRATGGVPAPPRCRTRGRRTARRATPSAAPASLHPGEVQHRGEIWVWSLAFAPAEWMASGTPGRLTSRVYFVPGFGGPPGSARSPPRRRTPAPSPRPRDRVGVQLARPVEQAEEVGVQAVPHPSLLPRPAGGGPSARSSPTRPARPPTGTVRAYR